MAISILDRVPVDQISEEAKRIHLGRLLLTLLVGVFYAIGWTAGKATVAVVWSFAAMKIGWMEARKPKGGLPRGAA